MKPRVPISGITITSHASEKKRTGHVTGISKAERVMKRRLYQRKYQRERYQAQTLAQKADASAKSRARALRRMASMTSEELKEWKQKRSIAAATREKCVNEELVCKIAKCCGWKGSHMSTWRGHLNVHSSKWSEGDKCPNPACHAVFDTMDALRSHLLVTHLDKIPLDVVQAVDTGNEARTSDNSLSPCGKHAKCRFCGCCLPTKDIFAHMENHCVVRKNPTLAAVVADCQDVRMDLHNLDCHLECSCEHGGRDNNDSFRNSKLLAAMNDDAAMHQNTMDTAAFRGFKNVLSKMTVDNNQNNGYVYVMVLFDASKPDRNFRQFLSEDEYYVGFATDLNRRACMHRRDYLTAMHYGANSVNLDNLYREMREAESKGRDFLLVGLGDEQWPLNVMDAGLFVESMTLLVLGVQTQLNSRLSISSGTVEPWMQELFPRAAEIVVPMLTGAYKRLYVNRTGAGIHVLTNSGQKLPFDPESIMLPLKPAGILETASHASDSSTIRASRAPGQGSCISTTRHATISVVGSCSTSSSTSGHATSSSDVPPTLYGTQASSDQSGAIVAKRCVNSDSTEGSERRASVSSGNASAVFAPPVKKLRLITEPACSTSTLLIPDSIDGGPVTKHVKSFQTLLHTLNCSAEDVIRQWCPLMSKYFVASDGLTASHLPKFSPVVHSSESSESVELWPLPHGSIGTFAQSQRMNG